MVESHIFNSTGKTVSVVYFWLLPFTIDVLFFIKEGISLDNIIAAILVFGIFTLDLIIPYKKPVTVIISPDKKTLEFKYINCFGHLKSRVIDLTMATVSFKQRLISLNYRLRSKFKFGMRISLYHGNYFKNRIVIRQDDQIGYNKATLEQMFNFINLYKGT